MKKKTIIMLAVSSCFLLLIAGVSSAEEEFPTKPITLLVGFSPGGVTDIAARAMVPGTSKYLGQPVVVENKPGAGGILAVDYLVNSKPDGYIVMNSGLTTICSAAHTRGVTWGPKDFTFILGHSNYNTAIVSRTDVPWNDFTEWVQYVKQHPGFKYGAYGPLGTMNIVMQWLKKQLELDIVPVHFKGEGDMITNTLGGHVQVCVPVGRHASQIKAGKLKTLLQVSGEPVDADAKSVQRLEDIFPDAPLDFVRIPIGVTGPKGIPEPVRIKLTEAFKRGSVGDAEFVRIHKDMNMRVRYWSPEELETIINKGYAQFGELIHQLKLKQ